MTIAPMVLDIPVRRSPSWLSPETTRLLADATEDALAGLLVEFDLETNAVFHKSVSECRLADGATRRILDLGGKARERAALAAVALASDPALARVANMALEMRRSPPGQPARALVGPDILLLVSLPVLVDLGGLDGDGIAAILPEIAIAIVPKRLSAHRRLHLSEDLETVIDAMAGDLAAVTETAETPIALRAPKVPT